MTQPPNKEREEKCPDSCFPKLPPGSTRLKWCEKHNSAEEAKERIWIFIAYKGNKYGRVPIFSKLFNDHTELKEFSAKHSAENKGEVENYTSDYLDLTDTSLLSQVKTEEREKVVSEVREKLRQKCKVSSIGMAVDSVDLDQVLLSIRNKE